MVHEASAAVRAPIVLFTYFNPIMARGLDRFCAQAKEAGASGAMWGCQRVSSGDVRGAHGLHPCQAPFLVLNLPPALQPLSLFLASPLLRPAGPGHPPGGDPCHPGGGSAARPGAGAAHHAHHAAASHARHRGEQPGLRIPRLTHRLVCLGTEGVAMGAGSACPRLLTQGDFPAAGSSSPPGAAGSIRCPRRRLPCLATQA